MAKINEKASKHASMKDKNLRLLLELFRNGTYSTFAVGKKIGLSTGGAKKLVDEMLEGGIISLVAPVREHSMGRNPLSCAINDDYRCIVVVNYGDQTVKLMGLRGRTIDGFKMNKGVFTDERIVEVADKIQQMLNRYPHLKLGAISIAYIGKFDRKYDNYYTGSFRNCNINLYEYYTQRFAVRVAMYNDLNFSLLAQKRRGLVTGDEKSALLLSIGRGVACSIMINDKLYVGASGIAGEIGHNSDVVSGKGEIIEKSMDWFHTQQRICKRIKNGEFTILPDGEITLEDAVEAYKKNDTLVVEEVDATIKPIVMLLKNVSLFMDFGTIFLTGLMFSFGNEYYQKIYDDFYKGYEDYSSKKGNIYSKVKLLLCKELDGEIALGAFDVAQDVVFDDFVISRTQKTQ